LLINSRTDVAIAGGADGVHLRSQDISPGDVRAVWARSAAYGEKKSAVIAVSCHSVADVAQAAAEGADFAVFAPVFEKVAERGPIKASPVGLGQLREACLQNIPVLALGGVTLENARACLDAGAAGVAGIRLFQNNDIAEVVRRLRG
jgi:thiamine-phosphate pyrophosphorylase